MELEIKDWIMLILMIIIIILIVVLIIMNIKTKETFGGLMRRRILSKASLSNPEVEVNSIEGYQPTRTNKLFKGQFDYITDSPKPTDNVRIEEKNDVISNSGNVVDNESFGLTRINNNFQILKTDSTASKIAQTEDPANEIISPEMQKYIEENPQVEPQ